MSREPTRPGAPSTDPRAPFDFEAWARLAREDPEAFERRRRELLRRAIAQAPEGLRSRLEGLQWRVDAERARARHPMGACVRLFRMMWGSVYGQGGLQQALRGELPLRREAAPVLPLRRPPAAPTGPSPAD